MLGQRRRAPFRTATWLRARRRSMLLLSAPIAAIAAAGSIASASAAYYAALAWVLATGCSIEAVPLLQGEAPALVHVYSLARTLQLWDAPHYRARTLADDLRANLKNVAVPGTGGAGEGSASRLRARAPSCLVALGTGRRNPGRPPAEEPSFPLRPPPRPPPKESPCPCSAPPGPRSWPSCSPSTPCSPSRARSTSPPCAPRPAPSPTPPPAAAGCAVWARCTASSCWPPATGWPRGGSTASWSRGTRAWRGRARSMTSRTRPPSWQKRTGWGCP